jgi:probable rRNA maturation factor
MINHDSHDHENILGDIVISIEKILSESKEQNIEVYKYLSKISIHGTLHLLGYDHIKDKDYNKMNQLEEKIINKIV